MRIKKLQSLMREKELDCVILTTPRSMEEFSKDIYYYTGFKGWAILVVKQKTAKLLVPELEYSKAKRTKFDVVLLGKGKKEKTLTSVVGKSKVIGIDYNETTISSFKAIKKSIKGRKWKNVSLDLYKIRSIKDKKEIESIKKACKVVDDIFSEIIKNFKFKTEKELELFIRNEIRKKGYEISFPPIVASGKNASIVHHNNGGKIGKGFLLLDYGAKVDGYCSDMSRTIYLGKPNRKEIQSYCKLLEVQQNATKMLKLGEIYGNIDKYAREELKFPHGLGHGVGLNIHELPNLLPKSKDIVEENNVVTVEPGFYIEEKFGMRIEDTILVTKRGPVSLTKSRKELIVVRK